MQVRTFLISTLLAFTCTLSSRAQPNIILNDTFVDGERLTQNLPSSLAWYTTTAARTNLAVRNGALMLVANGSDRTVWGYFPALGLAIGDSLTFTVDVTFTQTQQNLGAPFKIACFNEWAGAAAIRWWPANRALSGLRHLHECGRCERRHAAAKTKRPGCGERHRHPARNQRRRRRYYLGHVCAAAHGVKRNSG